MPARMANGKRLFVHLTQIAKASVFVRYVARRNRRTSELLYLI